MGDAVQYTLDKEAKERQEAAQRKRKIKRDLERLNKLCVEYIMEGKDHALGDSIVSFLAWAENRT